jgi:hypothetical protein
VIHLQGFKAVPESASYSESWCTPGFEQTGPRLRKYRFRIMNGWNVRFYNMRWAECNSAGALTGNCVFHQSAATGAHSRSLYQCRNR